MIVLDDQTHLVFTGPKGARRGYDSCCNSDHLARLRYVLASLARPELFGAVVELRGRLAGCFLESCRVGFLG